MPSWWRPFLMTLAASLLLTLFTGEIRDTDIWLHLKTGRQTLEAHALTVPDPFSFTSNMGSGYAGEAATRYFNLTHEWLAQVAMYVIYRAAGFPGLVLARASLLIVFCALVGWIAGRRSNNFYLGLAAAHAAAGIAVHFQQSRPFLVTFVGIAGTMAILESGRRRWLLPPLFLLWANCHGGFFTGWLVLGAYCLEGVLRRQRDRQLWLVALASVAASALNPNGFRVVQILFWYRTSGIQSDNLEWQRPIFWEPGMYSFLLFGSLVVLLLAWRRARPVDWLLYACFAPISLMAVRNTIFLAWIGPVLLASYLPRRRGLPVAAALIAAATLVVFDAVPLKKSGDAFAFRAALWQLPVGAADFIQRHRISDRMFNGYENGGYLVWRLWPLERSFIDPRGLSEQAYADYRRILFNTDRAAESLLAKYGIRMIVVDGFDYLSGQVYPLVMDLTNAPEQQWKLAYADASGIVLMRRPPPGVAPLDPMGAALASLEAQCERHILHDRTRPLCARGMGELYSNLGDTARARWWIGHYRDHWVAPDPEADRILQSMEVTLLNAAALNMQANGDTANAEAQFRRALSSAELWLGPNHPDTAGTLNNLGTLLEDKGDIGGAEACYRRSLDICERRLPPDDPRTAQALDNLAGLLESKGEGAAAQPLNRRAQAIRDRLDHRRN